MEYTELSAYELPAGTVTSWTPRADAGRWQQDSRDLSPGHEAHLRDSEPGSWIGSVLRVPAPYEPEALRRAIHAWLSRHEVLRTTVTPAGDGGWRRVTAPAEAVAVRDLVVGDLTADQVRTLLPRLLADVSPTAWPHCVLASVTPHEPGTGFVLAFGADHSVMDAYSQLLWFEEIVSLYDAARRGVPDAELEALEVGSHVDFSAEDRKLAMTLAADGEPVRRWLDFLGPGAAFPRYDGVTRPPADAAEAARPQASRSEWLATVAQTDELSARSRARGASAQSGVLAAFAHAARRVHGLDRLRFVLPMHTRYAPQHAAAVGWYVGLCPVDLDLGGTEPLLRTHQGADPVVDGDALTESVGRVHAAVAAGKPLVRYSFARIAELGGIADGPHFAVSYVDTRFVPGAERWSDWSARTLRSPAHGTDELYLWFLRTHEGLNVSARYPDTPEAHAAMDGLVAELRTHLRAFGSAEPREAVA
ncbi:condensation domain-containing protein [Promicromonospora citrea]|nr:condensation domain-containing protein [Promicromonospora citrea]NNH55064.1 Aureobasidin A1 biosynthesis complex [Promicromonospora citrea]